LIDNKASTLQLPGLIVSPDWLAQHLNHPALRLLDVRLRQNYDEGHIPGTVWVDLAGLACTIKGVAGMVLPPEPFAVQMRRLGLNRDTSVVVYDDHWGMPAARLLWSLARYGHFKAAVLNGGADRWLEEGRPRTTEATLPAPAHFDAQANEAHLVNGAWLLTRSEQAAVVLVDTRTPGEYAQGHLPHAISWDWMRGISADGWDYRRPADELRTELAGLGITPDKEIVTYCESGVRAAHTYLLLRDLGYPKVRLYDGSWLEWSRYYQNQTKGGGS
jgi:thiosulfate/3-mercaptopyruvate sulfurtransferase